MNKVYKVVWNASLGAWVAVSELAKTKTKNRGTVGQTVSLEQQEQQNGFSLFFNYKSLSLAIFAVFTTTFAFAGYIAGSGSASTNCTNNGNTNTGIAIGNNNGISACASSDETIAIGATVQASGSQSTAIGNDVIAAGAQSVVIGSNFNNGSGFTGNASTGVGGVAIGSGLTGGTVGNKFSSPEANGQGSLAFGSSGGGTATGNGQLTINGYTYDKNGAVATGAYSAALLQGAQTKADRSIAFGVEALADTNAVDGVALGTGANASIVKSVALGAGSTTTTPTGNALLTGTAAVAANGVVSVGSSTATRRIQNVADGSAASDAVTVSQLDKAYDDVHNNLKNVLGGNATYNAATNTYTAPTNIGGTGKTTLDDAIKAVKTTVTAGSNIAVTPTTAADGSTTYSVTTIANPTFTSVTANNVTVNNAPTAGTDATNKTYVDGKVQTLADSPLGFVGDSGTKATRKLGEDLNVKGGATGTLTSGNIGVVSNGSNQLDIKLAETVNLGTNGSVTTGNTKINNSGLTITGGPSVTNAGINAGNNKISNVANGAVTAASKDAVNGGQLQGVADSVKTAIGGNTTIDATTGAISTSNIGGTGSNTIDGAITNVKSTADAAKTTADKGINFGGTTGKNNYALGSDINVKGDSNIISTTVAGGVQLGLANNITVGSGAGTNPVTINGTAGTVSGLTNKTWSGTATSGQAATEDQLKAVSDVASNANKGWKVNTGATTGGTVSGNASTQVSPDQEVKFIAGKNVAITQSGKDITVATSDNPNFTSVTTGNSKLDNSGLVIKDAIGGLNVSKDGVKFVDADGVTQTTNTPSLNKTGINAGNNKISNVANGAVTAASKDAVNGSQLFNTANDVKNAIGGNTTIDATTGAITTNNIGGTGSNTIDGAITNVKATADKGINFGGTTGKNNYALGSDINVKGDSNITSTTVAGGVQLGLGDTLNVKDAINVGSGATKVKIDGTTNTIGGLSNTTWNGTAVSGQAATEDQLAAVDTKLGTLDDAAVKYDNATTKDKITLGGTGGTTITNVKAGEVTAASKDAVNGSQLFNTANDVKNAIGGNTTIDATTGAITTNNIGGTGSNTIDGAITNVKATADKGINFGGTTGKNNYALGSDINVKGDSNITSTTVAGGVQLGLGDTLNVKDAINVGSGATKVKIDGTTNTIGGLSNTTWNGTAVSGQAATEDQLAAVDTKLGTLDDAAVKYDNATTKDKITLGGTGGTTITNVKAGEVTAASKDAVNGSQLFNTANDVKNAIGGNTTIDATTGAITTNNIGGTGSNTIDGAITNVKSTADAAKTTADKGINFGGTTGKNNYALGSDINVKGDSNITSTTVAGGVQLGLGDTLNVKDAINVGSGATKVKIDGTTNTIGGLSNTTWNGTAVSGQAATEDQLAAVDTKLGTLDEAAVKYDNATTKDKITLGGTGGTTITNVKAGEVTAASKDAVNGSQLFNTANDVKNAIGGNTTIDATTGAITTNNIGGTGSNTIDGAITNVKATADKGINFGGTTGKNNYALGSDINVKGDSNITSTTVADGVQLGLGDTLNVKDAINVGSGATKVKIDGTTNTIGGLSNTTWNGTAVSGQAATEDQLAAVDTKLGTLDEAAVKYDNATTKDKITLGGTGGTTITNVKAGEVTAASKDAVNGSQLFNTANDVKNAIGGNTTIDATTGAITTNNIGGTGSNTIDGAITNVKATADKGINFGGTTGKNNYALGSDINVKGDSNITSTTVAGGVQLGLGDTLNVKDAINVGSGATKVKIDGTTNTIGGLSNTTWNGTAVSGQAATEDQLAAVDTKLGTLDEAAVKYDNATTKDKITLGGTGGTTITNVKAGEVTAASKDAVNGSQLFNTANDVKNAIGGNTTIDATTGAISTSNIGGTGSNTIDGAITNVKATADKGINFGGTTGKNNYALGSDINVKGDSNITSTTVAGGVQLGLGDTLNVKDAINVGSGATKVKIDGTTNTIGGLSNTTWNGTAVSGQAATEDQLAAVDTKLGTLDDAAVKYDNATTKDKITLGGTGGTTITNVKAGEVTAASKDAVNGSQLFNTANDVKNAIGGNTTIDATTGAITTNNIGGTGSNTIDGAITNVKATADKGINFGGTTGKNNYALGSDINVKGDSNITSTTVAGGVQLGLGDTLNVKDAINVGSGATKVKIDGTTNTIGGLSNTTWSGTAVSGQAATEDQLAAVDTKLGTLDEAAVKYDNATTKDKITLGGTGGTTITNVKAGEVTAASKDAVNGSQLFNTANDVKNAIGGNTTIDATTGAITTNNIGGTGSNTIDGAITNVKSTADAAKTTADKGINFGGTTGKNNYALGSDINVKGDSNITSTTVADGVQLGLGDTLNVKDAINVGSGATKVKIDGTTNTIGGLSNTTWNGTAVSGQAATEDQLAAVDTKLGTLDEAAVKYDNATTKDKITLGGTGGTTITNVKAGEVTAASKDAVNGSQLFNTANDVKNAIGGNTTIDATTGAITTNNIGGTGSNTIDGAITNVKATADKGINFGGTTGKNNYALGSDINVKGDSNITSTTVAGGVQLGLGDTLNVKDAINVGSGATKVKIDGTTNTIGGLSNTTWNGTAVSGQAATEDQLAAVDTKLGTLDEAAVKYDNATTKDKITLGGTGGTTITNVKAGEVTAASKDAVNGSQLFNTANDVKNAIGGNTTIDATTGAISTSNIGGTGSNTIDGAITNVKATADKGINFGGTTGKNNYALGSDINVKGDSNITSTTVAGGVQLGLGDTLNVKDAINVGSGATKVKIDGTTNTIGGLSNTTWNGTAVSGQAATEDQLAAVDTKLGTLDDAAVKYDNATTKDKITLGGTGGTTITNVKAGEVTAASKDAVNGSQLFNTANDVKNAIGGNTTIDATTGAITTNNIGGTGSNTIDGAITNVKATADKGINFGGTTGKNNYALGSDINVKGDSNITSTTVAGGVQLGLGDTLNVKDAINVGSGATKVKIDGTTNTIGGLSNTTWNGTAVSGQAATEDQLAAVNTKLGTLDDAAVKYDNATTKDKITLGGTGGTTITNVKAGEVTAASKDAVNGSQLFNTANDVKNAIGGNTTIDATTGAITTNNIGGTGSNTIDGAITNVKATADKGINFGGTTGKNNYALGSDINVKGDSNITSTTVAGGVQLGLGDTLNVKDAINVGSGATKVKIDGTTNTIGGLSNTTWNGTAVSGQAATEDQLAAVDTKLGTLDDAAVKYDNATTKDKITLGGTGGTTITNVKAGEVTAASKDAVNGSQLFNTANDVKNAIGGNTTIDATTGAITTNNIGGTGSNTIDGAITNVKATADKGINFGGTTGKNNYALGSDINVKGDSNITSTTVAGGVQLGLGDTLNVKDAINVGSGATKVKIDGTTNTIGGLSNTTWNGTAVSGQAATEDQLAAVDTKLGTLDDAAVKYDNATTKDKITLGGTGGTTITNVKAGEVTAASKDAVNGSQLFNTANDVKNAIGGNTTIDATTGAITTNNIGGTGSNTIDGAITNVKATADKGINFGGTTGKNNYALGSDINVKGDSNITSTTVAGGVQLGLGDTLNVKDAINVGSGATKVKIDGTTNTIGGLSNTTWNGTAVSGQAATEDQLAAVDTKLGTLDDAAVKYDNATTKDKITLGGTGGTTITNVKAGEVTAASKDAVNGSQLFNTANDVKNAIGGNTTIDATTGAITTNNIGGTGSNTIDGAITNVKATADKGINFGGTTGKNNYALGSDINVKGDSNITSTTVAGGVQLGLGDTLNVKDAINVGSGATKVKIDGTTNTIGGLSNTTWNGTAVSGQAATEDQLAAVDTKLGTLDDAAVKYDNATTKDKITLGGTGGTTITNVKAGEVTAASKDAVNGSQLFNTANDVKNAIGGNTTIDATTGAITTNNIGGTGSNTIDGAITNVKATADKGINFGGTTGKNNYALGSDINVKGDSNITSTTVAGGVQLGLGDTLNVKDAINVGSGATKVKIDGTTNTIGGLSNTTWNGTAVSGQAATEDQLAAVDTKLGTLDDAAVKYDNATTKDKITLGGTGGTTITNVKAGEVTAASKDAVNGSQLFNTANDVKNAIGGNTTIDATTGAITTNNIGGTGSNTIDGAITNVKATADKGINFGGTTGKNNYALGSDINVKGDSNITSTTVAGGVQLGLGDTLNVKDAINVGSGATKVKIDGTTNTIGGLSNTTWNGTAVSGQAATEDQLAAVDTKLGTLDDAAVKYDNATTKDKITLGGTGGTTITNVKAGEVTAASKDAVNGSQLFNTANDVKNAIGGNTTIDATTGAITTNNIGGTGSNTIDGAITNVKATADKGINFGGTTGKNNYALGSDINVKGDSNITSTTVAGGVQLGLGDTLNVKDAINVGSGATKVKIDGTTNTIGGLSNTTWNGTAVSGQAATEDQLAAVDTKLGTLDEAAVKYDNATTKDKITLGGTGGTTITNVKAGEVTAASKDAVNGSQLFNTANDVKNAIGGNTTIDATTGAITTNNIGGTGSNTIDGAITNVKATADKGINFGGTTGKNNYALGSDINVKGDSNITSTTVAGGVQLGLGDTLNVKDAINVGSGATKVKIDGTTNTIGGLSNTTWNGTAVSGQAATEDQLAAVDTKLGTLDEAAVKYDNATTKDKITLGGTGGTTITNVKAGEVTAASKDAVNGSQLFNTANDVKNAIGGNTTIDATTGAITTNNIGGTGSNTIDGAITNVKATADKGINFGGTTGKNNYALGSDINVKGDSNITSTTVAGGVQLGLGDTLNVKDAINVGSGATKVKIDGTTNTIGGLSNTTWNGTAVSGQAATEDQLAAVDTKLGTLDDAAVKYDNATTKDKITLGGTGGTTITNVKAGEVTAASKDAVNGSQLFNTANDVKNAIGGNTTIDATTGAITTNNIGGTGSNTIDGAITNVKATADKGINFGGTTGKNNYALGSDINVKGDSNITSTTVAGGVQLGLGDTLNVKDAINVGSGATKVKIDGTTNTIGGLSNTTWNGTAVSGQAATEDQLAAVDTKLGTLDEAAVKYDNATTKDKITLGGTGGTTITNVKAGEVTAASKDAVNGSQLFNTANDVKNAIGGNTTIDATTGAITTNNIGGTGSNTIDGAITNVKATADKGINFGGTTGKNNYALGSDINVKGDSNITSTTVAGGVQLGLGDTLNVKDAINVGSGATKVKIDGTTNTIGGLSNTTWNGTAVSGQAATEDQLAAVDTKLGTLDDAAVKYDNATTKDKITLGGTGGTTITNVKAGEVTAASKDAVNGSQLFNTANDVKNAIGGNTTIDATTGAITTNNIGGTGSNTIDGAISSVKDAATKAKTTVTAGDNVVVTPTTNADGSSNYQVSTAKDVNFDKVTVGNVVVNKASNTIEGLSNTDIKASDFATKGRTATEEQLKSAITSNITEVVDGNGNKVNIVDQIVNKNPDNNNQDSLFLTYDKKGQETTDRLTIGQTVQKMNTDGIKFFHTNADTSKGDLGTTNDSSAGGLNSTAVGVNAIVADGADSALAVGHDSKATGKESIAIGKGAEATGLQSISIGTGNKVKGDHSGAIGDPTIVDGANSYSVGNNNQVLTDDTFVLGNNVTKTVAGSVVLGNGSAATTGAGVAGYALSAATSADKAAITKTTSTTGAVAVGDEASGIYRQITGVAAGSADADAVNVAQLKAVGNQVVTTQTALVNSLGGGAKVNADGTITGPTYNVAQANQTNVGDALTALDKAIGSAATTSKTTVTNGQNIVVKKSKNADGSDNYEVETAKDLAVDSVKAGDTVLNNAGITIGNNAVVLNNTGLIIAGGPSVTTQGINAGDKQVTNVAAGVNATDAVNKGQLDSAISNVNNNVNELANNAVKYDDAKKDKITLGGADGTTITNVKNGNIAKDSKDAVNGGQVAEIRDNLQGQITNNTNDINNIKNDINNGTVGLVKQANSSAEVTVAKDTGGTSVNVAGKDGDRVVTGVKDGAINATSKDAINGSQLNATNKKVVEFLGGGAGYDNITNSFTNPTYSVGGKDYNNVGGAVDALNKADQALGSRIDNLDNKLEQAFYSTNQRIEDVEKKANAGIAAAMALEAAPYIAGKYTYAAGASYHGGENAVGVTLRKTADNGRWSITGGVAAASQGDPSVRIGISGVID